MTKRKNFAGILYLLLLILLAAWLFGFFDAPDDGLTYSDVVALIETEQVESFVLEGDILTLQLREKHPQLDKTKLTATIAYPESFMEEIRDTVRAQKEAGTLTDYQYLPKEEVSPYAYVLPIILAGLVLIVVWVILAGRANRGNPMADFGKAHTIQGQPGKKVTFEQVAGMDEEKEELCEVVDFLRSPEKYTKMGAKIPHGILLAGPPGTGKTLLAKAVAGEADVQFLSISGSDFMEMYVGVGASRVRDLFAQAKRVAPSIIFIDEIDAVGRKRGSGMGGGHDEREQTLNQLLVEMDGFNRSEGVIVLAATNRPDILDPALLRPGRFDRQIHVNRPDVKGRHEILLVHAKDKSLDETVDLKTVAKATSGFTGADLSNLLNEAAILAARKNCPALSMKDLDEAMMKIMAGPEKRSRVKSRRDLKTTAIHEAGHAIAMYRLPTQEEVRHITIIPRGRSLGATWHMPKDDSTNLTRNEMYEEIVSLLGGRVAEALYIGDISVGASNDIDRATALARDMVARYGMCESLGTVSYISDDEIFVGRDFEKTKGYSEKVAGTIDDEVKALIDKAYDHCRTILTENNEKMKQVVTFLLEHESMSGKQFAQCMEGQPIEEASEIVMFDSEETE